MVDKLSAIPREIRQKKRFWSRHQEGVLSLLRTADVARRALARVVEPHGITLQQYNVLRILRGAGPEGLPTLDIADRMIEQAPGITRLMDRLGVKKLVRRERCPTDRRQVLCWITPAGLDLLKNLDGPILVSDEAVLGNLSKKDVEKLLELLDAIRAVHD